MRLGLLASVALGAAGAGVALWTPGWRQDRFSTSARALWRAVAQAVLADLLPTDAAAREAALDQHLDRLQATVAGLPPATRKELSQLLALLDLAPSRLALTGLRQGWAVGLLPVGGDAFQLVARHFHTTGDPRVGMVGAPRL